METSRDNQTHEKSIGDYLISRYQPSAYENTDDSDQQFAKPIEDEDMFGSFDLADGNNLESVAQSKRKRHEKLQELSMFPKPKKFAADCDDDGMIGFDIEVPSPVKTRTSAGEIFQKAANKRVKDKYGLYKGQKLNWDAYNVFLLKKLSAERRKHWNSLHRSLDKYDDEEELIGDHERADNVDDDDECSNNENKIGETESLHEDDDENGDDGDEDDCDPISEKEDDEDDNQSDSSNEAAEDEDNSNDDAIEREVPEEYDQPEISSKEHSKLLAKWIDDDDDDEIDDDKDEKRHVKLDDRDYYEDHDDNASDTHGSGKFNSISDDSNQSSIKKCSLALIDEEAAVSNFIDSESESDFDSDSISD